jgi:nucleoside-diphosphate-sugar epimerase
LVTGAAGLLGRATAIGLADAGVEVHALVRSKEQAFRDDIVFHGTDLSQPLDLKVLPAHVDAVFHLAQAREFRDFPGSAPAVFSINVASTASLLDYAYRAGATNFVYASSGGVYAGKSDTVLSSATTSQRNCRARHWSTVTPHTSLCRHSGTSSSMGRGRHARC